MFDMVLQIYVESEYTFFDKNVQEFWICQESRMFCIWVSMLLNNAWICLYMPEAERKITVIDT